MSGCGHGWVLEERGVAWGYSSAAGASGLCGYLCSRRFSLILGYGQMLALIYRVRMWRRSLGRRSIFRQMACSRYPP